MSIEKRNLYLIPNNEIVGNSTFYTEDVNGFIPCVEVLDTVTNVKQWRIHNALRVSSWQNRNLCFNVLEYQNVNGLWSRFDSGLFSTDQAGKYMLVNDTTFVYENTGIVEPNPYEDDLTKPIPNTDPQRYVQKLKDGLITEYEYYLENFLKPIYFPMVQNAMSIR